MNTFLRILIVSLIAVMAQPAHSAPKIISDKTLVAWVSPANLAQKGGSVLTIEKSGGVFDAIVLGELAAGKWMAGSNTFTRTQRDQAKNPAETAKPDVLVQIAIAYKGRQITIYRNGKKYADYTAKAAETFTDGSLILLGLRHRDAMQGNRFFTGKIDDARIYDTALDAQQLAKLRPNEPSDPQPLAWWDFENGSPADRMNKFPTSTLVGRARIAGGMLHLDNSGAYMLASARPPTTSPTNAPIALNFADANQTARALREKLLSDRHRPGYHFVVPEGRCMPFDPNGAIFWKGRYHLFYIFQDRRGHNWGHVSSTDLFHWRHHPTDLVAGMFSGNCFINKDGRPTMCYHQVGQGNAMAVAVDDDLNKWKKLDSNPITPKTVAGDPHHGKYRSWDPFGWREGDNYYAIFGGKRAAIAKSSSLAGPWKYVGDLLAHPVKGVSINEDISCADMFKLGNKHMLLCISHRLGCRYYLGDWKNEAFHPTFHAKMSWVDNSFFAPESLVDDRGRRIMWAWIFDGPGFKTRMDYGWSGTMSLPRVLSLGDDGMLRMKVPKEIERLRYQEQKRENLTVKSDAELPLKGIGGDSLELLVEISGKDAQQFGVKVRCSPDGEEQTLIYYDRTDGKLKIDTRKSSLGNESKTVEAGPLKLAEGESLRLRIFIDKSVVEVFANDRQAVMRRIYPSREDSVNVSLFANGGSAKVKTLQAWKMMPSNPY